MLDETSMRVLSRAVRPAAGGTPEERNRRLLENPPLRIEPVTAAITFKRTDPCKVYALDHDGRLPADAAIIPVKRMNGRQLAVLEGSTYRTMYYLVEFTE